MHVPRFSIWLLAFVLFVTSTASTAALVIGSLVPSHQSAIAVSSVSDATLPATGMSSTPSSCDAMAPGMANPVAAQGPTGPALVPPPPSILDAIKRGKVAGFTLDDLKRIEERKGALGVDQPPVQRPGSTPPRSVVQPAPTTGTRTPMVLLGDFADLHHNASTSPPSLYQQLLFSVGSYPLGSMREFYREASYDLLDVAGTVYASWPRVSRQRHQLR